MAATQASSVGFPEAQFGAGVVSSGRSSRALPMWKLAHGWLLVVPLLFFAVDSKFSFLNAAQNTFAGGQGLEGTTEEVGTSARLVLYLMIAIIAALVVPHLTKVMNSLLRLKALAVLSLMPLLSVVWSIDKSTSLKESLWIMISTLFAVYFAEELGPQKQMQVLWMTGIVAAVCSVPMAILVPSMGVSHLDSTANQWQGIFSHKNVCASSMFFLLLCSIYMRAETQFVKIAKAFSILLFLGLIFMTHSVTGLIITSSSILLLPALRLLGKFKSLDRMIAAVVVLGVTAITLTYISLHLTELLRSLGRDPSLSGRTAIWSALIVSAWKQPLLGYGYHAFWQGLAGESANVLIAVHWIVGYAHNGLLELWIGIGLVGVGLFFLSLGKGLKDATRSFGGSQRGYIDLYISILLYNFFYSFDEAYLLFSFNIVWFLFVVSCVSLNKEARMRGSEGVSLGQPDAAVAAS